MPAGCLAETRYEDLVQDPIGEIGRIYSELKLGGFEQVREKIEQYLAEKKNYQTNRYELEPEVRLEIKKRWGWYCERYGYTVV